MIPREIQRSKGLKCGEWLITKYHGGMCVCILYRLNIQRGVVRLRPPVSDD